MGYKKITLILCLFAFLSAERSAYGQSATFNYTGALQTWTVPVCVSSVTIQAYGAQGGESGGLGAEIVGTFTVNPGDVLDVMVGQLGLSNNEGTGGGGTFVWSSATTTLMVAAGGGGGTYQGGIGGVGSSTTTPTAGTGPQGSSPGGSGGNGGSGGSCASSYAGGAGGAGWSSAGGTGASCGGYNGGTGGNTPLSGGAGGTSNASNGCTYSDNGGYGGGGASSCYGAGGGGGYNGGGGAQGFIAGGNGGGGGGSFNGGSNQTNTAGVQGGNGTVTIIYAAVTVNIKDSSNVTCHGGTNGIATCHPTGGGTPYTYFWQPGNATTQTISNLSAGVYTVTVTLPCGGTNTATVTITQPAALGVTATVNTNIACNGGNGGKITANPSNGSTPYAYSWSNSQTTVAATGLTAGSYTVTVTDNCGATATVAATVTQPAVLTDSAYTLQNISCSGGSNGSAGSLTMGGTRPYTYLWAPGGKTTDTIVGLSAGTYTVTVTDSHGCTTSSSATITEPTALQDSIFVIANVLCNGQNNASIGVSVMGATSPYTYLWTPGGQTTANATSLSAGTYSILVHDNNGCSSSASMTVTQPNVLTATANAYSNVVCNGNSDGNADVMPMGGTLPYTYSWTPGGASTDTAMGLSAGTYTVNVWDSNDCNTSTTVTVTQPIALIVGAGTVLNNLCNGDNIGMAVGYVSGGPAPYTYSWTPSGGNGDTASGLSVGTYTVTVTDINGCTGSAMTMVTQPSALSIILNSVPDDGSCSGSAWLQVTGGVGPYTYLWESGGVTSYIISNQCAGNYCCRVTDANGCYDNVCVDISSYLGVNSLNANSGGIKIYPNPTNGQFTIENVSVSESSVVEVYNVLGEEVYSTAVDTKQGGTTTVNIGNEPNGVYVYRVKSLSNGNVLGQGKIVLEK